jgi:hypothetical protein
MEEGRLLGTANLPRPLSPPDLPNLAHLLLTCFGCICEFRSTNGTMNRYVPIRKAQLKFFHRPLSSLVQRGRAERKTKEQEREQGERQERRGEKEGQTDRIRM